MSISFDWFKEYSITKHTEEYCFGHWIDWYELSYNDRGSTSHSAGNVIKVQNLFVKYCGVCIPTVIEECINSTDYDLGLIEPTEMAVMCDKVLATDECDRLGMRDRIEGFKQLSEEGYYIAYSDY